MGRGNRVFTCDNPFSTWAPRGSGWRTPRMAVRSRARRLPSGQSVRGFPGCASRRIPLRIGLFPECRNAGLPGLSRFLPTGGKPSGLAGGHPSQPGSIARHRRRSRKACLQALQSPPRAEESPAPWPLALRRIATAPQLSRLEGRKCCPILP